MFDGEPGCDFEVFDLTAFIESRTMKRCAFPEGIAFADCGSVDVIMFFIVFFMISRFVSQIMRNLSSWFNSGAILNALDLISSGFSSLEI